MPPMDASSPPTIDIEGLGLDQGALLLLRRALADVATGDELRVRGSAPAWQLHLSAWCRHQGHGLRVEERADGRCEAWITRSAQADGRWRDALSTGPALLADGQLPLAEASPAWGLAARGAIVEAGGPSFDFTLTRRDELWAATAGALYRQAAAAQWDPEQAIDWSDATVVPDELEAAVVQLMTYLIENENAALLVPARHLGRIHPYYREVMQLLALQCADEARHVEVFTRRATLRGSGPARSSAGGQASLKTLLEANDFSQATFLLSVLGEGTFVNLLNFLHEHAPDPITRQIARLTARDEARHVAFGMAHVEHRVAMEPGYVASLRNAIETRYDELAATTGLNEHVFDALVLLAAGSLAPADIARGHQAVQRLQAEMAIGRKARLARLGFAPDEAERLAGLHTRNFM